MARYTTLSPKELARIVAQYRIGVSLKLEEIPGGFGNSNFKLTTTNGEFLLKICDEKDSAELNMQISLLQHLHQHAYPTVYPILTKDQNHLIHETFGSVMLYPFLQGTHPQPSPNILAHLGEALAKLHRIPPITGLHRFAMGISQMRPFFQEVRETQFATHPFIASLKSQLESMESQLNTSLPMGLLHGDLFLDNTLFDGDKMLAILDFEEGCYDTLLIDVGMTIIGCCYTSEHRLNLKVVQRFLNAYNAIRPLTESEWQHLDCFVHYAALSIAFWRFRQFNIRHPDAQRANTYQEMITRSEQWKIAKTGKLTKTDFFYSKF
ncbi:homoserine kinase [Candidatus Poribacteria bacterium]|nr:homoserine kinase [Candidatus Poribacteria bacterium]MYH82770.1 homoserine kinase [Candidatus Poribacteria bacterium]MYK95044.1 homoserine kinase [Candidatus Poribacteria bacterium]